MRATFRAREGDGVTFGGITFPRPRFSAMCCCCSAEDVPLTQFVARVHTGSHHIGASVNLPVCEACQPHLARSEPPAWLMAGAMAGPLGLVLWLTDTVSPTVGLVMIAVAVVTYVCMLLVEKRAGALPEGHCGAPGLSAGPNTFALDTNNARWGEEVTRVNTPELDVQVLAEVT